MIGSDLSQEACVGAPDPQLGVLLQSFQACMLEAGQQDVAQDVACEGLLSLLSFSCLLICQGICGCHLMFPPL